MPNFKALCGRKAHPFQRRGAFLVPTPNQKRKAMRQAHDDAKPVFERVPSLPT